MRHPEPGVTTRAIRHGGLDRSYRLFHPAKPQARPGLVFLLHGAIGTGAEMARLSRFDDQAEKLGWIAVYPDAHQPGPSGGWSTFGTPWPIDDVGFVSAILEDVASLEELDERRVFAAGFSRGGMLAHRLGYELGHKIAAIASVAGNAGDMRGQLPPPLRSPSLPVSVLVMHGTNDRNVPIEGGVSPDYPEQIAYAPLSDVLRWWRDLNGCSTPEAVRREGPATVRAWQCPGEIAVELWVIEGGTHAWPGPHCPGGSSDRSVDASRTIADFFFSHPRA